MQVYFGTFGSGAEFSLVSSSSLIQGIGYDAPSSWNAIPRHGINVRFADASSAGELLATVEVIQGIRPQDAWCSDKSIMAGVMKCNRCVGADQGISAVQLKSEDRKGTVTAQTIAFSSKTCIPFTVQGQQNGSADAKDGRR